MYVISFVEIRLGRDNADSRMNTVRECVDI